MKKNIHSPRRWISYSGITASFCLFASVNALNAATDPGPRGGAPDAGGSFNGPVPLSPAEVNAFGIAQDTFNAVDSVDGSIPGQDDAGLGPTFNLNSCAGCHAFPVSGGTSPRANPQFTVANMNHRAGAPLANSFPSFLSSNGPIREVRFKRNADGSPDGGVHALFVITGRTDAPDGFNLAQTNFNAQIATNNVVFRIPTPVFGLGLIEAVTDENILAAHDNTAGARSPLGILGKPNRSGNDGTITRFGWKAQNKSLLMFAGEAYNVEQGVTNDLFPNSRELGGQVLTAGMPDDGVDLATGGIGDIEQFMVFMRLLDPPRQRTPAGVSAASIANGSNNFTNVGCVLCHTRNLRAGVSAVAALSNRVVPLFSDLLIHHMGSGLADDVSQGAAGPDEFRTAPLWGAGQRLFFLHDGRAGDLVAAIAAHSSPGSEANVVIQRFNALPDAGQQDVLNYLRSL